MKGIYKYIIYLFITLFISTAESLTCSADNTSTYNNWKIHQSYHFPTRTEKSGNKIYVLANGGLFSYDKSDDNITIYSKNNCIQCKMTKKLLDNEGANYQEINIRYLTIKYTWIMHNVKQNSRQKAAVANESNNFRKICITPSSLLLGAMWSAIFLRSG